MVKWTRLSCRLFAANAVRLQPHALAYNLSNFLRTPVADDPEGEADQDWSEGRHAHALHMAEVAIPQNLFADILRMIAQFRPKPDPARLREAFGRHAFVKRP